LKELKALSLKGFIMGFRINTNIAAMDAHRNSVNTNKGLDKSLQSLSSGLRINVAADDASGMTIADSLRSQALGLGQAINNANDGVSVVQTADGALDEYINIINTVRTKSIQAASDGQNADSRQAIQRDIDRLLEAADSIANTTQFNGQKLLDGTFTNKAFHIGAYANETVNLSVDNVQTDSVGAVNTANDNGAFDTEIASLASGMKVNEKTGAYEMQSILSINGQDVTAKLNADAPNSLLDASSVAAAISDATDVHAVATNEVVGSAAVAAGTITAGSTTNFIHINGVDVGTVDFEDEDASRALSAAINGISDLTGVTASVNEDGVMTLTSTDGSNISIEALGNGLNAQFADAVTSVAGVANTHIATAATTALTINTGELIINGVDMAGTYGSDGVAGSAHDALEDAIQAIDGLKGSSIANDGTITLKTDTGIDVNVADNSGNTFFADTSTGIFNSANQGTVKMYSDKTIQVSTEYNGDNYEDVLGFKDAVLRTSAGDDRLSTIDVTSRRAAELSILVTDSALKQLDATRSDLGSVQNQLESTIRNISVTQVNVTAAESQIRDVDFAAESANFAKLNILAQSGSYAMSQANAVQQNVLRLLQ
jgi:flagellin